MLNYNIVNVFFLYSIHLKFEYLQFKKIDFKQTNGFESIIKNESQNERTFILRLFCVFFFASENIQNTLWFVCYSFFHS